jgi:hypothetical protein
MVAYLHDQAAIKQVLAHLGRYRLALRAVAIPEIVGTDWLPDLWHVARIFVSEEPLTRPRTS